MGRLSDAGEALMRGRRGAFTVLAGLTLVLGGCTAAPAVPTAVPAKPTVAGSAPTASAGGSANGVTASPQPVSASPAASPFAPSAPSPLAASKPAAVSSANTFDEQAVANFYRGKTIRLIVGFGPGGGYDIFARTVARTISKFIPGNPTVIVENVAGAGSAVALAQTYRQLPKDGTILTTGSGGLGAEQALGLQTLDFDASKWQYIGAPDRFEYLYVMSKKALDQKGIKTFKDILGPNGKQIVMAVVTATSSEARANQIMRAAFGANIKPVSGYSGTAAEFLATATGEVDGLIPPWDSAKAEHGDEIASGELVLLAQFPEEGIKGLPYEVPKIMDLAQTEEQRELLRFGVLMPNEFVRTYVMAPEVPADRVAAMRAAFDKTMADPGYLADIERVNLKPNPLTGQQLQQLITDYFNIPAPIKARLKEIYAQVS